MGDIGFIAQQNSSDCIAPGNEYSVLTFIYVAKRNEISQLQHNVQGSKHVMNKSHVIQSKK